MTKSGDNRRIIGLDFGSKTVGVAVSDALFLTAQGVEIVRRESENKLRKTLARITEICQEYDAGTIVLGLPLMLEGDEGIRCEKTRAFGEMIAGRTGLPVIYRDERLTTVEAIEIMDEMGVSKKDRYLYVDKIAAMVILQGYLDEIAMEKKD